MAEEAADLIERMREERRTRGHLYAGMRFKRALVERLGVDAAFALAPAELGVPGLDGLHRRPIRPLVEVARAEGLEFRALWPGGAWHELPLPRVVGAGDAQPIVITDRAAYLACLDEVLVRGRSDVLLRRGEVLMDFEPGEYDPACDNPQYDPALLHATATEAWTMEPARAAAAVPEALMLCGAHAMDFGHWLLEYLPRLGAARRAGWRGGMPVLVDATMPATVRAALERLLPADAPLLTVRHLAPLRVQRLWCVANPIYFGFFPSEATTRVHPAHLLAPQRYATLLREFAALADAATAAPTGLARLFLARRPQRRKRLVNAEQIEAVLRRHEFHCVYPEDLDLVEQLRLVRHATHIVAPEGSNSLLALFASPGAASCTFGPPSTQGLTAVSAILEAQGVAPLLYTGPSAADSERYTEHPLWSFWNDYRIDAAAFEAFLGPWLAGRVEAPAPGPAPATGAIDIADLVAQMHAETPRRGHLAARMHFKRALVARCGVDAAFALAAPELGVPRLQTLRRRGIRSLKEAAQSAGLACRELWPGGEKHALPLPRVVGEGNQQPIAIVTRSAYLACLPEVLVRGRSDLLLRGDDEVLLDFEGDEYDPAADNPDFDPAVLHATATHAWTMEPEGDLRRLPEALMLSGARTLDFGHWLVEYLPKLALARLAGWRGGMPVLVDKTAPQTLRDALAQWLPADAPLVTLAHLAPLRVGRLWCLSDPLYLGFYPNAMVNAHPTHMLAPPQMAALLREVVALAGDAVAEPTGIALVYLDRRPKRKKQLVNGAEIRAMLEGLGFHCVYPEELSLAEQLRLVRHARFIVAPEGSNSLLALFAASGAKTCVLSSPYTQRMTGRAAILEALGVEMTIFTGPCERDAASPGDEAELWAFWDDYRIDAAAFERFLCGWLG